jgi:phage shock protein PspC (stress-responsive transcriptional regulator)
MTTKEPNNPEPGVPRQPSRVERSRTDRVLGGVCAGIARSIGVDPLVVRIAAVLLGFVSAGAAVIAYGVAWVLLPQAADEPQRPSRPQSFAPPAGGAKEAWTAVGGELKSLAAELRPGQAAGEAQQPDATARTSRRPSVQSVDAALTAVGDRLRAPEVQEGARRTVAGLSAAVDASVEELGKRARRDRHGPAATLPAGPDRPREQP